MRRFVLTMAISGVALCAVPSTAVAGRTDPTVSPKGGSGTTASAARIFLNIREAKREIRRAIRDLEAKAGNTTTYVNVYGCRRHSRVRVHCRFFERGTFFDQQNEQLGYKCTGKARVRETATAYFGRNVGVSCYTYPLS